MAAKLLLRIGAAVLAATCLLGTAGPNASGQAIPLYSASARRDFSAPYDLRGNPKLGSGELEFILSKASGGPYRVRGNSLEKTDARGRGRALSSAEVLALLRARSRAVVRELRALGDARLAPSQRAQAESILRQRYMLLDAGDRQWLEKLFALRYGNISSGKLRVSPAVFVQASANSSAPVSTVGWGRRWGGGNYSRPTYTQPAKPAPKPAAPKSVEPVDPIVQLRKDLGATFKVFPKEGTKEKIALSKALDQMMKSSTARQLAQELVKQKASVNFSFQDVPRSKAIESRGRKVVVGELGHTIVNGSEINVVLNRRLIEISPDAREIASVLSHEMLGHGRQEITAQREGLFRAYNIWDQNEINASLVGWTVRAELGLPLDNWSLWSYLRSPADHSQSLKTVAPFYAQSLSKQELDQDLVKLFKERRINVQKADKNFDAQAQIYGKWKKAVEHFVQDPGHREEDSKFAYIREEASNWLDAYIPYYKGRLDEVGPSLDQQIAYFQSGAGISEKAALRSNMNASFFKGVEAENSRLYQTLQRFAQGKSYEGELPPFPSGQLNAKEFQELYKKDKLLHPQMDQ